MKINESKPTTKSASHVLHYVFWTMEEWFCLLQLETFPQTKFAHLRAAEALSSIKVESRSSEQSFLILVELGISIPQILGCLSAMHSYNTQ